MAQPGEASTRVAPTAALTVKAVERLAGSGTRLAYAVKAGPWIFLNGHEAFDFERGLAPEVEGPSGHRLSGRPPLRREADYILQRMRTILKEFGCDLRVRLQSGRGRQRLRLRRGQSSLRGEWRARPRRGDAARAQLGRRERLPPSSALRDQGAARTLAQGGGVGARAQPQGAGLHPRRR